MENIAILVLAAGLGKRLGGKSPKVLSSLGGFPLLQHVLRTAAALAPSTTIVITGFGRDAVEAAARTGQSTGFYALPKLAFVFQQEQLGTGDAVKSALSELQTFSGTVVILSGDVPLLRTETLNRLLQEHHSQRATLSLLTFKCAAPNPYGVIIRDASGRFVEQIVEKKDCSPEQSRIEEVNGGVYAVDSAFLVPAIKNLTNNNAQKEYYLTDIVAKAAAEGQRVVAVLADDHQELLGVNTFMELAEVKRIMLNREIAILIENGVEFADPASVYVDSGVKVAAGVKIGPNVQLRGRTEIHAGAVIEGSALLIDTVVHEGAVIKFAVRSEQAVIGKQAAVGPFANLRPETVLGEEVRIGNFVETKKAILGKGAKASHLTYLGDAEIGADSNIGAGTITCNYDGIQKQKTKIGKGVFVGSDTCLVAPIEIADGAYIGAGSVITKPVPADSLAFTRPPQVVKEGWAKKKRR
ncbi:MAG: bifunctional UDP-N-acetylglucosamine diphosphorylase/glucosamine-1-phosphate N-acetyltransferase GlmU [Oligoflexia bacterium]|nr:bifunctional UDP-N-acetylglucosamine diphosphorylase/glucosamine-1-phosphate N-acetyltransferase GlmU [Oligoflexia bacterium]